MVGGQKFGCSYPSYCCVLPPDFKQAKFECLSEWCREAHTAVIRQVPFLHPFSNLGDTMISQLNRFKNLYSLPGYTAQIWVAFSWACQADLTESSYPATNLRHHAPPPTWAGEGSCSISESAGRCQEAACPALCWQSSVQVTVSYRKLSQLFLSSHLSKIFLHDLPPSDMGSSQSLGPSSFDRVARYLFRNHPFSALLFYTQRLNLEAEDFCLAVQGTLQQQRAQHFHSNTFQFRSREHISPDFPPFVYKMGIHSLHGKQKSCKQRQGVWTPCLSNQKIIWSVTTVLCERRVTSHAHVQPQVVLAVGNQRLEDNLLQPHDPWCYSALQWGAGSCAGSTWLWTRQKALQLCTSALDIVRTNCFPLTYDFPV